MGQALKRFIPRSPRYVLRPEDNHVVRFAGTDDKKRSFTTEIIDVSATGLAFKVHHELRPRIGDVIMIEFTVPGAEQMACYGRVVRLEEPLNRGQWKAYSEDVIVGVKFFNLLRPHEANLHDGLQKRFRDLRRQQKMKWVERYAHWLRRHRTHLIYFACAIALMILIFYWITLPTGNYSPLRYVPWGQRHF